MTPKEKAFELFNKYIELLGGINSTDWVYFHGEEAKQCAIIAVDEIIIVSSFTKIVYTESTNNSISEYTEHYYWTKVKKEIEKL